jgi:tetratricopeptide (TPR) repeat protein
MNSDTAGRLDQAIAAARRSLGEGGETAERWHDLGVLFQERGSPRDSRDAFERAVALDPAMASAHNNLGNSYNVLGELDRAVTSYRRALALDPSLAPAHANAAAALYVLGRNDEALEHVRRAAEIDADSLGVQINAAFIEGAISGYDVALTRFDALIAKHPNDAALAAARAYVLLRLERFEEALAMAQHGLSLRPDYGLLLESAGCALRALGRFDEAVLAFDRAIALGHDPAGVLLLKASGLLELGEFAAARTALERALAIAPDLSGAWNALAELQTFAAGDPLLATMEDVLERSPRLQAFEARTLMHFALGKAYHKSGDRRNAFRHFAAGNAMKRRTFTYDVAGDERFARDTIAFFTPAVIAGLSGAGDVSRAPIFVVGMPRSGTSLVEQILASHPGVYGAGELTFFDRAVRECGPENPTAIGERYLALVDSVAPAGKRVVDKLPSNFRHAALIHLALPRAPIVHVTRDALDTCFSCYVTLFTGRQDFSFDLVETGRYYRTYAALMDHWHAVLPPGVMLDVRYEDLIADLEAGARRMLAFCDLPWDDAVLRYYETSRPVRTASFRQVRQPVYASSVGTAQAYRADLQPLIDALHR